MLYEFDFTRSPTCSRSLKAEHRQLSLTAGDRQRETSFGKRACATRVASSRANNARETRRSRVSPAICPDGSCRVFLATPVKIERVVSRRSPFPVPRSPSSDRSRPTILNERTHVERSHATMRFRYRPSSFLSVAVCQSIDIRNNVDQFSRLEGCRVVEGFVQILLIDRAEQSAYANLSFPDLVEITGYLVLYRYCTVLYTVRLRIATAARSLLRYRKYFRDTVVSEEF